MKFDHLVMESLNNVTLKKVRVKIDPATVSTSEDLSKCGSYEGYVLAEDSTHTRILVIMPDNEGNMPAGNLPVIEVPNDCVSQVDQQPSDLEGLKQFIISALNLEEGDPLIQHVLASTTIDDIEIFLKDNGLTDNDIKELYKYYII